MQRCLVFLLRLKVTLNQRRSWALLSFFIIVKELCCAKSIFINGNGTLCWQMEPLYTWYNNFLSMILNFAPKTKCKSIIWLFCFLLLWISDKFGSMQKPDCFISLWQQNKVNKKSIINGKFDTSVSANKSYIKNNWLKWTKQTPEIVCQLFCFICNNSKSYIHKFIYISIFCYAVLLLDNSYMSEKGGDENSLYLFHYCGMQPFGLKAIFVSLTTNIIFKLHIWYDVDNFKSYAYIIHIIRLGTFKNTSWNNFS